MTPKKLAEILAAHKLWLNGEGGGVRADLSGANLSGAKLNLESGKRGNTMAEYIEREHLLRKFNIDDMMNVNGALISLNDARNVIEKQPAADVAPVVHGWWEWFDEEVGTPLTGHEREWGWQCSSCKQELPDDYDDPDYRPMLSYCPNCGARMDGNTE